MVQCISILMNRKDDLHFVLVLFNFGFKFKLTLEWYCVISFEIFRKLANDLGRYTRP